MDANTPGTNTDMTPQTPESPAPQPVAPQNTPAGMAASPSEYGVSGEDLQNRLDNLNSPRSVTDARVTDARRQILMTPIPQRSPLSSPLNNSLDLGTPRPSEEPSPPSREPPSRIEEVDLIELRF